MAFGPDARKPQARELENAHAVLQHTRSTVESFFKAFEERRSYRGRGASTDHEYELLRAMLSKAQLLRAGSFFDLPSGELVDDMALFDDIFGARNQIVHEMDIDFSQPRRNRAPRPKQEMVDFAKEVLACAAKFLAGVDGKLAGS